MYWLPVLGVILPPLKITVEHGWEEDAICSARGMVIKHGDGWVQVAHERMWTRQLHMHLLVWKQTACTAYGKILTFLSVKLWAGLTWNPFCYWSNGRESLDDSWIEASRQLSQCFGFSGIKVARLHRVSVHGAAIASHAWTPGPPEEPVVYELETRG